MDKARKSRTVHYGVVYKVKGKQIYEPVGKSVKAARDRDAEIRGERKSGELVGNVSDFTYEQLFAWYEEKILPNLELEGKDTILQSFKAWTKIHKNLVVNDTKTYHLDRFKSRRTAAGIKPRTLIKHLLYITNAVPYLQAAQENGPNK